MDIEYKFHCSGCSKPDKEFPVRFEDYEIGDPMCIGKGHSPIN